MGVAVAIFFDVVERSVPAGERVTIFRFRWADWGIAAVKSGSVIGDDVFFEQGLIVIVEGDNDFFRRKRGTGEKTR